MEEILASIRKIIADEDSPVLRGSLRPTDNTVRSPVILPEEPPWHAGTVTPIVPPAVALRAAPPVFGLSRPPAPAGVPPLGAPVSPAVVPQERAVPAPAPAKAPDLEAAHVPRPVERLEAAAPVAPPVMPPTAVSPKVPDADEPRPSETGALVSAETTNSVSSAFQALTASVALTAGDAIDRHVREMVRPMLRAWLDDNLPVIVEKLVRAEIERVARGGR